METLDKLGKMWGKVWEQVSSRLWHKSDKRSGDVMLQLELAKNPFYPFTLGLTYEDRSRVFTMRVPYAERHKAEQLVFLSSIALLLLVALQLHKTSVLTVYVTLLWVYNVAAVINYRHERIYIINEGSSTYSFVVGTRSYTGRYHNVYVRLRKVSDDSPKAPRKDEGEELPRYELVLNGLYMDQVSLSGRPTTEVKTLRKCVGCGEPFLSLVCCPARR
jgi:hypothetical protein